MVRFQIPTTYHLLSQENLLKELDPSIVEFLRKKRLQTTTQQQQHQQQPLQQPNPEPKINIKEEPMITEDTKVCCISAGN